MTSSKSPPGRHHSSGAGRQKEVIAAPGIGETKTIAEEGFIFGLPLVMAYAAIYDYAVDTGSGRFKTPRHSASPFASTADAIDD